MSNIKESINEEYREHLSEEKIEGIKLVEELIKDMRASWLKNDMKDPAIAADVILEALKGKYFRSMVESSCRRYLEVD